MANPRTIARLESRILERAAVCLQSEVSDPRATFITVTRVKLSPDLSSGRIYYSVLGTEGDKSKAAHMLESAAGFLQRQIAVAIQVRRMPHLKWTYDDSLEIADDVSKLIREARARDRAINPHVDDVDPGEAAGSVAGATTEAGATSEAGAAPGAGLTPETDEASAEDAEVDPDDEADADEG